MLTLDCQLTGHVHHAAVAQSQHLVGLAEQAAGADAIGVVPGELLLAGGAAVPPGLGQVGQLNTHRGLLEPGFEPSEWVGGRGEEAVEVKRTYPLLLT